MAAYYNEHDPFAAAWLKSLIREGLIADGEVDDRSILLVQPADLRGFTQCHFFAGIGGWSYALRLAGWSDARPVWTGSCPCQPFSSAGKGDGESDPRDLWPAWFQLWRECRPDIVFGEQVAKAVGGGWFDRLCADVEGLDYAVGAAVLGAHSAGGWHIRQRLWFVADRTEPGRTRRGASEANRGTDESGRLRDAGGVAESQHAERRAFGVDREDGCHRADGGRPEAHRESGTCGEVRSVADTDQRGQRVHGSASSDGIPSRESYADERESPVELADTHDTRSQGRGRTELPARAGQQFARSGGASGGLADASRERRQQDAGRAPRDEGADGRGAEGDHLIAGDGEDRELADADGRQSGNGDLQRSRRLLQQPSDAPAHHWSACDWLPCRDGKLRPVEPGTFPLAHGVPARVGRLRGYGNAIVPQVAQIFIETYLDTTTPLASLASAIDADPLPPHTPPE